MTSSRRVMRWVFAHSSLKVLSVGLAVLLWMVVAGEETVERGLRVPLELLQVPDGIELLGEVPTAVDVRMRGASGTLSRVGQGDVVAVLDLRSAKTGRRLFPIGPDQVRAPYGVQVVQVSPSSVAMAFEASFARHVPVVPSVDGRPAPGYVIGPMTAEPAAVEVVGPESLVKRVTEVLTEPVAVTGAKQAVRETVSLGVLDPALRLKTARSAVVTVQVVPAPLERTLRNRPVHLRNVGSNYEAQALPAQVDVAIRGNRDALNRVGGDDVAAYVDLAGLGPGQYSLTVHADSPPDAGIARVEPASVQVRILPGRVR